MIEAVAKCQCLCTLVRGKLLCQFDSLYDDVESMETLNVDYIIRGLYHYFTPVNSLSKTEEHNAPCNEKPCSLTIRSYVARLIDLNEYLYSFPGETLTDNISVTKLNKILLNSMPNSWSKQAYFQGFDYESINFKKYVKFFEHIEIVESIYEGVVEPSYKKTTWAEAKCACHIRHNMGESASSWTCPGKSESAGKRRKRHVDSPTGKLKTYLIHGLGHSSE